MSLTHRCDDFLSSVGFVARSLSLHVSTLSRLAKQKSLKSSLPPPRPESEACQTPYAFHGRAQCAHCHSYNCASVSGFGASDPRNGIIDRVLVYIS